MEKTNKDNKSNINSKDIIISVLVPLTSAIISANFSANDKSKFLKVFFIILIVSLSIIFISIKLFSDKKEKENKLIEKLNIRLINEVEAKKDLERQKEEVEKTLELSKMLHSYEKKDKERLEKDNKKLENVKGQLRVILVQYGVLQEDVGVDENISYLEWEKKPEIKKKIEDVTNKNRREKLALEDEVSSLRKQLKEKGVPSEEQNISDERKQKESIWEVERHWNYYQKNDKINGKTIIVVLGESWKSDFNNKEGKEIIKWRDMLIKRIYEEVELTKNIS